MTKGSVSFHPSLDLAMKMRWAKITKFDLVASGAFDGELGVHLETDGAAQISYEKDLWESPSWTFVQMVGPVPVVEVVSVGVSLEVTGSTDGAARAWMFRRRHTRRSPPVCVTPTAPGSASATTR